MLNAPDSSRLRRLSGFLRSSCSTLLHHASFALGLLSAASCAVCAVSLLETLAYGSPSGRMLGAIVVGAALLPALEAALHAALEAADTSRSATLAGRGRLPLLVVSLLLGSLVLQESFASILSQSCSRTFKGFAMRCS